MKTTKTWEADGWEISVNGKDFFVYANFSWERESVDYRFDPSRGYAGQGQDRIADVAKEVEEIEIYGADDETPVAIADVPAVKEAVLTAFRDSEHGAKNFSWGAWL